MGELIRTGGGRFDPAEPPVFFLAVGPGYWPQAAGTHTHVLVAVNDLESDSIMARFRELVARTDTKVFLDSGIFNLTNRHARAHGLTMDQALTLPPEQIDGFDELLDRYCRVIGELGDQLWGYVELDLGGAEVKRRTRAMLHDRGLRPIPVYHPFLDGWDYFDELASSHDRICFGNIVKATKPERLRLQATMAERHRRYPDLWVHLLGISPSPTMLTWPTNSCDSSAWLAGMIWMQGSQTFGHLRVWDLNTPEWRYRYGSAVGDADHHNQAALLAMAESQHAQLTWRHAVERRRRLFGEERWPESAT